MLVTATFMIILDRVFDFIGWYFIYDLGEYFNTVIGVVAALLGIFLSFRTVLKAEYRKTVWNGVFFGISTSIIFLIYGSVVVGFYMRISLNYWLQVWAFRVFLFSLIGCLIGFLLGGSILRRMPPPQPRVSVVQLTGKEESTPVKAGVGLVLFLLIGAAMGYFAGYIVWVFFGQIQIALGVFPPYAALFPPPLMYLIGWAVLGALSFPFKILPELSKIP